MLACWRDDLPIAWRTILDGAELAFESRALHREMQTDEIIVPGRKGAPALGAPKDAHIFRAFDNIDPAEVRALILGQEPYANPAWATGRAFEQGNLVNWPENRELIADSLRRIVQVLASARTRKRVYVANDRAWQTLIRDVQSGALKLEPPRELFDRLEQKGVLFLNASLTVSIRDSRPRRAQGHYSLCAPLISRILAFIATRRTGHAVFLLWGQRAWDVFERARVRTTAECAGTWKTRIDLVRHVHPAAITVEGPAFLKPPNSFLVANQLLRRMGAKPIHW
jgi:uracil-DNA glycosylase